MKVDIVIGTFIAALIVGWLLWMNAQVADCNAVGGEWLFYQMLCIDDQGQVVR